MKIRTVILAVVIIGAAATTGFVYSGIYDVGANSSHSGIANSLLSAISHASIERRASAIEVPDLSDDALALAGIGDFDSMCAGCHGAPGRDPEPMGIGLNPPAPDLAEEAEELTPAELFWVTKNGIKMTGMPAWGKSHTDDELWPVVALMTRLPELDADGYQAMLDAAAGLGHHSADAPVEEPEAHDDSIHEHP